MTTFAMPPIPQMPEINVVALFSGQVDLRTYPFRHLALVADRDLRIPYWTAMLMAAEMLSQTGWELVSVVKPFEVGSQLVGYFRRA